MTMKRFSAPAMATDDRTNMAVTPPTALRDDLPWYRQVGVNWAVSKEKAGWLLKVEGHKAQTTAELEMAATDNIAEQLMLQMGADTVVVASQIGEQLSARVGQAQFNYAGLHMELYEGHLRQRFEFLTRLEKLAAQGVMTPQELADAKLYIYEFIQMNMDHTTETTGQALTALKAHADRAFSHIARMKQ